MDSQANNYPNREHEKPNTWLLLYITQYTCPPLIGIFVTYHLLGHNTSPYSIIHQNCPRYCDKVVYDVFTKCLILSARFFHSSNDI